MIVRILVLRSEAKPSPTDAKPTPTFEKQSTSLPLESLKSVGKLSPLVKEETDFCEMCEMPLIKQSPCSICLSLEEVLLKRQTVLGLMVQYAPTYHKEVMPWSDDAILHLRKMLLSQLNHRLGLRRSLLNTPSYVENCRTWYTTTLKDRRM